MKLSSKRINIGDLLAGLSVSKIVQEEVPLRARIPARAAAAKPYASWLDGFGARELQESSRVKSLLEIDSDYCDRSHPA
jgi:hypothetical protein